MYIVLAVVVVVEAVVAFCNNEMVHISNHTTVVCGNGERPFQLNIIVLFTNTIFTWLNAVAFVTLV